MAATGWFILMAILTCVLLFITSLFATISASDVYASSLYNTNSYARAAHYSLTIALVLGWIVLAIFIIVLIVAAVSGIFTWESITEAVKSKDTLSKEELLMLFNAEKQLSSGQTAQAIVLFMMIILGMAIFVVGVFAVIGAVDLSKVPNPDSKIKNAYSLAIWASIFSIGVIGAAVVAIITYIALRSTRRQTEIEIKQAIEKDEKALKITDAQLEAMASGTVVAPMAAVQTSQVQTPQVPTIKVVSVNK